MVVEASGWLADNQWILDLAAQDPFLVGLVGHIDPNRPEFGAELETLAANPLFRGIRCGGRYFAEIEQGRFLTDMALLADKDLELDVLLGPDYFAGIIQLAQQLPNLRIVVNHIGLMPIDGQAIPAEWVTRYQQLAAQPNVYMKVSGFMERPDTVYRRYPSSNDSMPARYARAIAAYRHGDLRNALSLIDALIRAQPNNPYFHELKGQALLEGGKPNEAIAPLRKAVQLSNNAPLIEMLLGQAFVASENKAYTEEAIRMLRSALVREPEAALGYTQLAMAYGRKGDYAEADLASAQAAFLRGDQKTARDLASRAKTRFAIGTPGWVKADDIVNTKPIKN